jgi:hypothetical protein
LGFFDNLFNFVENAVDRVGNELELGKTIVKDSAESFKKDVVPAVQEVGETIVVGGIKTVTEGDGDYTTSYQKNEIAKNTVARAKKEYNLQLKKFEDRRLYVRNKLNGLECLKQSIQKDSIQSFLHLLEGSNNKKIQIVLSQQANQYSKLVYKPIHEMKEVKYRISQQLPRVNRDVSIGDLNIEDSMWSRVSQAEHQLTQANKFESEVQIAVKQIKIKAKKFDLILVRVEEIETNLQFISTQLDKLVNEISPKKLGLFMDAGTEKKIGAAYSYATVLQQLMEMDIVKEGKATEEFLTYIKESDFV